MKKRLFFGLFIIMLSLLFTGCGKKDVSFTMTCTAKKYKNDSMESQTVVKYTFNKEQVATNYTTTTTQTFKDKKIYDEYKKAQEQTIKENKSKDMKAELKKNDKELKLVFIMTLKNLNKSVKTESDKSILKAKRILKNNEKTKSSCKLNGISKNKLK